MHSIYSFALVYCMYLQNLYRSVNNTLENINMNKIEKNILSTWLMSFVLVTAEIYSTELPLPIRLPLLSARVFLTTKEPRKNELTLNYPASNSTFNVLVYMTANRTRHTTMRPLPKFLSLSHHFLAICTFTYCYSSLCLFLNNMFYYLRYLFFFLASSLKSYRIISSTSGSAGSDVI